MLRLIETGAEKLERARLSPLDAKVRRDHGLGEAQRLLTEGLRCLGQDREELPGLKKGDPRKAGLAVRIRTRTTMPNAWNTERLHWGMSVG